MGLMEDGADCDAESRIAVITVMPPLCRERRGIW